MNDYTPTLSEICVKAIIENPEGKILLLRRRKDGLYGGALDLPGGMLETAETPIEGLRREIQEETGLNLDDLTPVYTHGAVPRTTDRYCVWIWFKGISSSDTIGLDVENSEYQWMRPNEALLIADDELPVVHKEAIRVAYDRS